MDCPSHPIVTGSTVVYPYNDTSLKPAELGASIFVDANKNLVRAAKEFNLDVISFEDGNEQLGVWDGSTILVTVRVILYAVRSFLTRFRRWERVASLERFGKILSCSGATATDHQ
jgi:hypothetical protein